MNKSICDITSPEDARTFASSEDSGEKVEVKAKYLSVFAAATMIATWNTTSTLMNFPYIFGQFGLIMGPLLTLGMQGLAFYVALHQIKLTIYYTNLGYKVDTFSDLGECLMGKKGRYIFMVVQMSNQIGFLPYALDLSVGALQRIFYDCEFLKCNGNTMVIVIMLCYFLVQLSRDWKNFHWLAYLVFGMTLVQAGIFASYAFLNKDKQFGSDETLLFFGQDFELPSNCTLPVLITGNNTEPPCITPDDFYTFDTFFNALGAIVFSFAPAFILTELMSEMKHPEKEMKAALTMAFSFSSFMNEFIGLTFVLLLGNQIPMQVQHLLPEGSVESIMSQLIILFAMILDFVISVLVINRMVVLHYFPAFDFGWTWKNAVKWGTVTFLPMTVTFALALLVPNFDSMITFVTAFSIPYASYVLPSLFSLHFFSKRGVSQEVLKESRLKRVILNIAIVFAMSISIVKFYQFIINLTELDFSGDYWCDQVAS